MSAVPPTKRRHAGDKMRLGERRKGQDDGSSRDASEEDNEEGTSDVDSLASSHHARASHTHAGQTGTGAAPGGGISSVHRRALSHKKAGLGGEMSDGVDSPVYDGDVESSSTIGGTPVHSTFTAAGQHPHAHHIRRPSSPTPGSSTTPGLPLGTIPSASANSSHAPKPLSSSDIFAGFSNIVQPPSDVPVAPSSALSPPVKSQLLPLSAKPGQDQDTHISSSSLGPPKLLSRPKELTDEDIKAFVQRAIDGQGAQDGLERWWKTRKPPTDRPVRIYADGVYDLFHFGHALQLRQAKLSFPSVHLLVGVCSDALCAAHKSAPAMTHAERCEAVRHCRWADEVIPDAPWVVDQAFMDKYQIDYLAHDEFVYPSKDCEDVYAFAKEKGMFLPTRRTPSISTSDLLERIVRGYRDGFFDSKLEKNGHPELLAADVDWDSSASMERRERRKKKGSVAVSGTVGVGAVEPLSQVDADEA